MTRSGKLPSDQDRLAFIAGGGEMGRLIRSMDWSGTSLGPVESWPQSLRTTVNICLASDLPICVVWGPGLVQLYNDGYRVICGGKHPRSMGQNFSDCWKEAWPVIGEAHDSARAGDTAFLETQHIFLERHGYLEECFFTFSFSPIRDEAGLVGGLFHPVIEMTTQMLGERRTRALRDLAARTSKAKSVIDALALSAETLAEYTFDLPFVLLYALDPDGDQARLAGATGLHADPVASPARIDWGAADQGVWHLEEVVRSGSAVQVDDIGPWVGPAPVGPYPEPPKSALVLPIIPPGATRPAAVFIAGVSPRLPMNEAYRSFYDLLASVVTTAVANARAYEDERRRAEALAELDRVKTAFFSNVSHEFRTPLTLMLAPVEDILTRHQAELSPAVARQLEVVSRNGLRLLRLVNSLLDFSRIEAGRVRASYQPTDLAAITAELASMFRAAVEKAGLRLSIDCRPLDQPAFVDREMWEKVVLNLLSNAFKFTFEGEIAVILRQTGRAAELVVRDTGTGIPPAEVPRLFERFHRVENARGRTHEGSGIGLALVQELVKLHGGTIEAESVVGKGTTFTVSVPLGSTHLPSDQIGQGRNVAAEGAGAIPYLEEPLRWIPDDLHEEGAPGSGRPPDDHPLTTPSLRPRHVNRDDRPRVLVADDNADMRQYVVNLLAEHFTVEGVPDGEAALAAVRRQLPDLILTDVMMPRLDGFGLLRELRADPRTSGLSIIMLSARAGEESRVEGLEAGADDYLVKPFSARELLARVTALLQMARMRREAGEALQRSHARFEALLNAAPLGVYLVDADLRIRQVNPKAVPSFGGIEGLIGRDFVEVLHVLWPPEVADGVVALFRRTLETGEPYRNPEFTEERHDSKVREFYDWQIHRISLPDGQYGVVCYFIDISPHVLARLELGEADRRKTEFLAMLAHELRNPLAPISNALQIMRLTGGNGQAVASASEMMERQVSQMVRLVDDLLDVSRISRGKIELRRARIELAPAVKHAIEAARLGVQFLEHDLAVELPSQPIYMNADPARLTQVVGNLLNNACKFTDKGGRIWLTVERENGQAVIRVRDTGIGIASDELLRIFDMFVQVDTSLERSVSGLGIGLTLVKNLVEMHDGTVEVHSAGVGRGSEFVVRLPILSEAPTPAAPGPTAGKPTTPTARRILVVDDNRESATSLAMLLKLTGNATHTAHDGLEAVEEAATFKPDVVLLDIGLPKLNGYEACRRIREQERGRNILLVALTGWGQEEDRQRSREAGFDGHLVKPVDLAALTNLLAELESPPAGSWPA